VKDLSENKLGVHGAESVKDILLHNSNITRFTAKGKMLFFFVMVTSGVSIKFEVGSWFE